MLSEIGQTKTNTVLFQPYVEFKKQNKWTMEKKKERDKPRNGLLTVGNKLMLTRGEKSEGDG